MHLGTYNIKDALSENPKVKVYGSSYVFQIHEALDSRLNLLKLRGYIKAKMTQDALNDARRKYEGIFIEARNVIREKAQKHVLK